MARKKKHEEHENHERWLVSYADFITLLFAFFTSMYAISNLDLQKAGRMVTSMKAAFDSPVFPGGSGALGGPPSAPAEGAMLVSLLHPTGAPAAEAIVPSTPYADGEESSEAGAASATDGDGGELGGGADEAGAKGAGDGTGEADELAAETGEGTKDRRERELDRREQAGFDLLQEALEQRLDEAGLGGQVSFHRIEHELSITLGEAVLFEPGSAEVRADAVPALATIASVLAATEAPIRIEGHTDDLPIQTLRYPSNWELSTARATAILKYMVETGDFTPYRFAAAGYGPYRPAAPNTSRAGRALNRRVEIVVVGQVWAGQVEETADSPASEAPGVKG